MLTKRIDDQRAWNAGSIDETQAWYYRLPERVVAALDETVNDLRGRPRPVTELDLSRSPCAACRGELSPALAALEQGRGFTIVEGISPDRYSKEEWRAVYWV